MNYSYFDNFGRIMPHMKDHVSSILSTPDTQDHDELIRLIMSVPQSQQYLFARDVIVHDVDAFSHLLNGMVEHLGGKHLFNSQECAFFASQLLYKRAFRGQEDSSTLNDGIAILFDGYTGVDNIFGHSHLHEFPATANTLNLEKIDSAICRHVTRIMSANVEVLNQHSLDELLINYKLPKTLECWLIGLNGHTDDSHPSANRVHNFIHHLIACEATDADYLKACVNALGLQEFADIFMALMPNRNLGRELKILSTLYGEDSILTEDRLTRLGKQASYGQSTKTLAVLASSITDWEGMPCLLSLTLKNLPFYHHEIMGFLPDETLVSAAITNGQQCEFVQGLLLTTVDPLLNAQEANKHQLTRLLEVVIANAQGFCCKINN